MKALLFERKEARFVAAAAASRFRPGVGARVGPLRLADISEPELPSPDWVRVSPTLSGICGSDLSTIDGHSSRYFEPLITFPFVLGHEVVGRTDDGRRVLIEPVLGHAAHGFDPPFEGAAQADGHDYGHLLGGDIEPGIQIGSCKSTGGGWGEVLVAHTSQLHDVPDDLDDASAVVVEPVAAGIHAALKADVPDGGLVAVLGAGMMGLAAIAGLRHHTPTGTIVAGARYPHQHRLAKLAGADVVVSPDEVARAVRRITGCGVIGPRLAGGADAVIDAVGNSESLTDAIGITRPRGRVVMLGMPAQVSTDLTALWHRETELVGSYCYGTEHSHGGKHTYELAFELVRQLDLGRLVSATYALDDYVDAIDHAAAAGARGAVRIAFEIG
ncbi:MAG: zinc-binding dehydrogenase [Acidimicrobiales bacterium]